MLRYLQAMGAIILAIAIGSVLALVYKRGLPGDATFWGSSFPSWLQGLGTIGATIVAWRALNTWQVQDAGRRKAELAQEVLRLSYALSVSLTTARYPKEWTEATRPSPVDEAKFVVDRDGGSFTHETKTIVSALYSYLPLIRHMFGDNLSYNLHALIRCYRDIYHAYAGLRSYVSLAERKTGEADLRGVKTQAFEDLRTLGSRFVGQPDSLGPQIDGIQAAIEDELGPIISGRWR